MNPPPNEPSAEPPAGPPPRRPQRWYQRLLVWPLALVILFEEWGWEPLQRLMGWIARLPVLAWFERRISALPPYAALAVFVLPSLLLLPIKLLALWLIHQGKAVLGATVIVLAKLVGTAIVARLFTLTKPALLRLAWFAALYQRWTTWKEGILAWVRSSWAWRWSRVAKRGVRRAARAAWLRVRAAF
jgi:hypothetical protein